MQRLERILQRFHVPVDSALELKEHRDLCLLVVLHGCGPGGRAGGGEGRGVARDAARAGGEGVAEGREGGGAAGGDAGGGAWDGGGGGFCAGPEEAVEAAGDENVPFLGGNGGEGGEHAVQVRVVQEVEGGFWFAGAGGEAVEALEGKGGEV